MITHLTLTSPSCLVPLFLQSYHFPVAKSQAALQAEGLNNQGTKEELLDRLVTRMTKEEMQEQAKLMKLDAKGSKMELKERIISHKESSRSRRL